MDKGCQCASYSCNCYKPNDIPDWKARIIKDHAKIYLNRAIMILEKRGRLEKNDI